MDMTLVSAIISDAFRESNRVAAGTSPNAALLAEALTLLNRIVASVMGWEVGENLHQWPIGTTGYETLPQGTDPALWAFPPPNSMLACNLTSAQTIYLPQQPSDGTRIAVQDLQSNFATYNLTLDGNGRQIEGAATLALATNALNRSWFFRADLGNWTRFTELASIDTFPFPTEFDDYFITMLTLRLAPRLGPAPSAATVAAMTRSRQQFIARYVSSQNLSINPSISLPYMSRQGYGNEFFSDELLT
jgi:hypothetical protein